MPRLYWYELPVRPRAHLVFLHGRGSGPEQMMPFVRSLQLADWGIWLPRAPLQVQGEPGAHWYLRERPGEPEPDSWQTGLQHLSRWYTNTVARSVSFGVPVLLGGFSQGATIALGAALGVLQPAPAGLLLISGSWPPVAEPGRLSGLPVLQVYAAQDSVVGPALREQLQQRLQAGGARLEALIGAGGHELDPAWSQPVSAWLQRVAHPAES